MVAALLFLPMLVVVGQAGTASATDGITSYTGTGIDVPDGIAWGPDGALWFTNNANNSIGRITTSGVVTNFVSTAIDEPTAITAGPDGALWFTNYGGDTIGRITTSGTVSTYPLPSGEDPSGITTGPDGNLWFTDEEGDSIGQITTSGTVTIFTGTGISLPTGITSGPDGALWFTNLGNNSIGRITTSGVVSQFTNSSIERPADITVGPDGALWFTNAGVLRTHANSSIGRITTSGSVSTFTDPTISNPLSIAEGPDGALWFVNDGTTGTVGRITTSGSVSNFTDSTIDGPLGITAGPDGALWFTNGAGNTIDRIPTQGAVTADGSATCTGVSGATTFSPPLSSSATSDSETATTSIALSTCSQSGNSNVTPSTVTGTLTSTTTYADNSCATFLAGGSSTSTITWTGTNPVPAYGISPTTLSSTGTSDADGQSPAGDLGIQATGVSASGSYDGPSSMTLFGNLSRAQFNTACAGSAGVSTLTISSGVVSSGTTVAGPTVTSAASTTFTEGVPGSFAVSVSDPLSSSVTCVGNLPAGVDFVPSPSGGGGQFSGTPLPGSAGTYPLTIVSLDSGGLSTSQSFTLTVAASDVPYVTGIDPSSGTNTLVPVTITGENFTGATAVDFGSTAASSVTVNSATSITVEEPTGTEAGPVDVTVTTPSGTSVTTAADQFTYDLPPQPPDVVSADAEGLGMYVTWAPNASSDGVTSYTVTPSVAAGYSGTVPSGCSTPSPVTVAGTEAAAEVPGLCAGVPYTATVTATNAYGTSSAAPRSGVSATARMDVLQAGASVGTPSDPVVPFGAEAPSEPLITSVLPRSGALIVSWDPPAQLGGDPLTSYEVTANCTTGAVAATVPATDSEYKLKKLLNGSGCQVLLTASSAAGTSAAATSTGTPEAVVLPGEPAGFQVEPDGHGHLLASWTPPIDMGTKPLEHYVLSWSVAPTAAPLSAIRSGRRLVAGTDGTVTLKLTHYKVTGLSSDSYYDFSIVAVTAAGSSPARSTNGPVTPNVTLNPGTIELKAKTVTALASDVGGVLTWPSPVPSQLADLEAGQVLAAVPTTAHPQGLLALVQSVYPTASGGITVYTTPASPSQAFLTFAFSISGSAPATKAGTVRAMSAGVRITAGIGEGVGSSGTIGVNYGNCEGNDVSACLNATLVYALDAGGSVDTFCAGFTEFGDCIGVPIPDGVTVYANASLAASASVVFDISGSSQQQLVNDVVGVIPLFFGIVLTPEVIVNLDLSGSLTFSASVNADVGGGFQCSATITDGAGCGSTSGAPNVGIAPTGSATASLNGTGTAVLASEGSLCIDVVACVNVIGNLSLTGTIDTSASPFLSICASVTVQAGVNLNLLIHNFNWDATLWSLQLGCDTQASEPPTLTVSASGQADGTCIVPLGTNIQQFVTTRSDGASDPPIVWSLENGVPGDSISSSGELTTASPGLRLLTIQATDATGLTGTITCTVGSWVAFTAPTNLSFGLAYQSIDGIPTLPNIYKEQISWSAPVNDGGASVVDYRICITGIVATHCYDTGGGLSYVVSDFLDPGTAVYQVQVWAINSNGAASEAASGSFAGLGPSISSVAITPFGSSEIVTISGAGFGNAPAGTAYAAGCGATGDDYTNNALVFQDVTVEGTTWSAGTGSNCIGLNILSYSDTEVSYLFGSFYGSAPKFTIQPTDTITVTVNGIQYSETIN